MQKRAQIVRVLTEESKKSSKSETLIHTATIGRVLGWYEIAMQSRPAKRWMPRENPTAMSMELVDSIDWDVQQCVRRTSAKKREPGVRLRWYSLDMEKKLLWVGMKVCPFGLVRDWHSLLGHKMDMPCSSLWLLQRWYILLLLLRLRLLLLLLRIRKPKERRRHGCWSGCRSLSLCTTPATHAKILPSSPSHAKIQNPQESLLAYLNKKMLSNLLD